MPSMATATPIGIFAPVTANWAGTAAGALLPAGWGWAREARAAATEADCEWAATDVVNGHTPFRARTT